ncbi:SDR family oxidoreductase [Rhizobium sp. NLR17b]|uniref:SDR family NAD(P)-dependent oxidoreductase n=1 Tax=Rhizobium sp. NLR17b TaxID=2731114 RepID=UPI001C83294C|nr:SDR family oxidoreductase [Rhizobium sp. NLR17b]MBX5272677.1 SDR family oxidoreductase [Rhizobium sp. NLR17b]
MYLQKNQLNGRTAFVTGAARGIGYCTAEALAEAGASVVVSDISNDPIEYAARALRAKGYDVKAQVLDVTNSQDCTAAAERFNSNGAAIDILIANAGISWKDTRAEEVDDASWARVLDVNLNGTFYCCRAFGRYMLERGRGSIVTVGSMSGFISNKPQNQVHYNASKAAVHHLTKSLAGEWADRGVRVNSVAPTYVNTPMSNVTAKVPEYNDIWMEGTPMKRMIEPEEVASVNLFLASDASSGMTGSVVLVDAGYTIW